VIAGFELVRTIIAVNADESDYQGAAIDRGADIGLGLGFLALFGASAVYGFYTTSECDDWREQRTTSIARDADSEETEELVRRAAAPRRKRRTQRRPPDPPSEIGGFALDWDEAEAKSVCQTALHTWTRIDAEHSMCSGTATRVRTPARTDLTFCSGHVCKVTVFATPDSDNTPETIAFKKARAQLVKRFGPATREEKSLKAQCPDVESLEQCLGLSGVHVFSHWHFASGHRLTLALELAPDAALLSKVVLRLELAAPPEPSEAESDADAGQPETPEPEQPADPDGGAPAPDR